MKLLWFFSVLFYCVNCRLLLPEEEDGFKRQKDVASIFFPPVEQDLKSDYDDWLDFDRKNSDSSHDLKSEYDDWLDFDRKESDLSQHDLKSEYDDWLDFARKESDLSHDMKSENEFWPNFDEKEFDLSGDLKFENEDWTNFGGKESDLSDDLKFENEFWANFGGKESDLSPETNDYDEAFALFDDTKPREADSVGKSASEGVGEEKSFEDFLDDLEKQNQARMKNEDLKNEDLFDFSHFPPAEKDHKAENEGWQISDEEEEDKLLPKWLEYYEDEGRNLFDKGKEPSGGFEKIESEDLLPPEDKNFWDILLKSEDRDTEPLNDNNPFDAYEEKEPNYYMLLFPPQEDKDEFGLLSDDPMSSFKLDEAVNDNGPKEREEKYYDFGWLNKNSENDDDDDDDDEDDEDFFLNTNQDVSGFQEKKKKDQNINFIFLNYYIININDKEKSDNSDISKDKIGNPDFIDGKDKVEIKGLVGNSDISDITDETDKSDENNGEKEFEFEAYLNGKYIDDTQNVNDNSYMVRRYLNRSRMFAISTLLVICSIIILGFCLLYKIIATKRACRPQNQAENYQLLKEQAA